MRSTAPDNLIAAFAAKVSAVFASVDVLNAAQAAGQEARGAFWRGASIPASGEASTLRSSITETIDSAIYRDSPPKLFLDIGKESGEAFWAGFNEAQFQLGPAFDQLTGNQILSMNLDPATQVFTGFDPLTVGQLQQLMDEELAKLEPSTEIQFDFDLQALQEQLAALADLTGTAGTEAREAFMAGLSTLTTEEITQLRASILDAVNEAIEAGSPSQLFIRIGENAGNSFWDGFGQAELTLKTSVPQPTGGLITSSTSSGTASGANVQLIINNPTMQDSVSDAARLQQIAGSVAHTYNQVRN